MLTPEERQGLLALARASVTECVRRGVEPAGSAVLPCPAGMLRRVPGSAVVRPDATGVFVTLRVRGDLRGCLGTLQINASLEEEVVRCAADSATGDPRFAPVCCEELEHLRVEISVLGPLERIDPLAAGAFTIGDHGLVVEYRRRRGLLLPQVAVEWHWTPHEFLDHTCVKAGLAPDAWRNGATVYRFGAEVFGD